MEKEPLGQAISPFADNPNVWFLEQIVPPAIPPFYHHSERHLCGSGVPRTDWTERLAQIHRPSMTIVIPQRNEERSIETAFGSMMLSDIPPEIDTQFVIVSNDCSDKSPEIVNSLMSRVGKIAYADSNTLFRRANGEMVRQFDDQGVYKNIAQVEMPGRKIAHLVTSTPGKANAVNIGARTALARGDRVLISTDADCTLSPTALTELYIGAARRFGKNSVLASSDVNLYFDSTSFTRLLGKANTIQLAHSNRQPLTCSGALFAVSPQWLVEEGGVPNTHNCDRSLAILALLHNKQHFQTGGTVWTRGYSTFSDLARVEARGSIDSKQQKDLLQKLCMDPDTQLEKPIAHRVVRKIRDGNLHVRYAFARRLARLYSKLAIHRDPAS